MKVSNLIKHDFASGVMRWRYLASAGLFLLPTLQILGILSIREEPGTWMDCVFYLFKGSEPITHFSAMEQVHLPISWLLLVGGCLFLNLDYLLNDLTNAGQQVLVRCNNKSAWYLSKCAWNAASCVLYFLIGIATTYIAALLAGINIKLTDSPTITLDLFMLDNPVTLTAIQCVMAGIVLPMITLITINQLQMMLCLFIKPILSFLICISILVVAVYVNTPFAIGNGAMVIRNGYLTGNSNQPILAFVICIVVFAGSMVLGMFRFQHFDILGIDE